MARMRTLKTSGKRVTFPFVEAANICCTLIGVGYKCEIGKTKRGHVLSTNAPPITVMNAMQRVRFGDKEGSWRKGGSK